MKSLLLTTIAGLSLLSPVAAHATTSEFTFSGAGTYGDLSLTYGPTTDPRYSQGFLVNGATGTFSDSNIAGFGSASVVGVQPLNISSPESTNMYAPADFSHYNATNLPHGTFLSYDDLFYPTGSPRTATDYPFSGGPFDIYGVLLTLSNGDLLNVWSNGLLPGASSIDYGIAVLTPNTSTSTARAIDYVEQGVANTPEPNTLALLGTGALASVGLLRRRLRL